MELELSLGDSPARLKATATPPCAAEGEGHDDLVLGLGVSWATTKRAAQNNQTRSTEPHHQEEEVAVEVQDDKTHTPGVSLSCPADLHPTSAQAAGSADSEVFSRLGFDVNSSTVEEVVDAPVTVKQLQRVGHEKASENEESHGGGGRARKKMRLSKEQSAFLENSFREHNTLSMEQKSKIAHRLSLRRRQVEVWFQNRRARTKLKQTEVEREQLKRCCETLAKENESLRREVAELRRRAMRANATYPLYSNYHHLPAAAVVVDDYSPHIAATLHAAAVSSSSSSPVGASRPPWTTYVH